MNASVTELSTTQTNDLSAILRDGVFFSVMVGFGETYVPAFALAMGLGEIMAGLIATLPMLAGAVFQLVTPSAVRYLASYRRWVVFCARLQAASFVLLLGGALLGRIEIKWLFVAMAIYWGSGMGTGPAWNAWVGALVPAEIRPRFFAKRIRYAQTALLVATLSAGVILDFWKTEGQVLHAFAFLFATALMARLASSRFLARQSEPPGLAHTHRNLSFRQTLLHLRGSHEGHLLLYLLSVQFSVYIAVPFFTPYMLHHLQLSYTDFTVLTSCALVTRIFAMPLLGRLAHARGTRVVLRIGAVGIIALPALWLVSEALAYLMALQLIAGIVWAALEFATLMAFFEGIEERDRASILTVFNLANTLAMVLGCLAGSWLFRSFGGDIAGYALVFLASSAGRLLTLLQLQRTPAATMAPETLLLRTIAVRPSVGGIERPILSTLPSDRERPVQETSGS